MPPGFSVCATLRPSGKAGRPNRPIELQDHAISLEWRIVPFRLGRNCQFEVGPDAEYPEVGHSGKICNIKREAAVAIAEAGFVDVRPVLIGRSNRDPSV